MIGAFITKLKIMTAHQQVLQGLAGVFQIKWPAAFKELLSYFQVPGVRPDALYVWGAMFTVRSCAPLLPIRRSSILTSRAACRTRRALRW